MPLLSTPVNKPHKKPLCEEAGHAWEPTTAPNFRHCTRSSCRLVQRKHQGQWVTVEKKKREESVEQAHESLWG